MNRESGPVLPLSEYLEASPKIARNTTYQPWDWIISTAMIGAC
jgi:hypothetical protein